jgi:monovalent cation/proton antiporter MnhG/PhaG subunit
MTVVLEVLAALLLVGGAAVVALAALGVARLPDPFSRMHAAAKAGVAGAGLVLLGSGLAFGTAGAILTALAAVAFLVLTAPLASHALGRAAYVAGAPLGGASVADALSGVLDRGLFDIDPGRTARPRPAPRDPSGKDTAMSAIPEFRRPADPAMQGAPDAAALRRILVCLVGGPAQREAAAEAMTLAAPAGAEVTGLSGAGLEPREWRGPVPVGGGYWAGWLAARSRARMREAAATALQEFESVARAHPRIRAAARHEEGSSRELAALLAGQDLIVVPAGVGPHGGESHPGHEDRRRARRGAGGAGPAGQRCRLRTRRGHGRRLRTGMRVPWQPACCEPGSGPAAPVSRSAPVADYRRGVRGDGRTAQAELLRAPWAAASR